MRIFRHFYFFTFTSSTLELVSERYAPLLVDYFGIRVFGCLMVYEK